MAKGSLGSDLVDSAVLINKEASLLRNLPISRLDHWRILFARLAKNPTNDKGVTHRSRALYIIFTVENPVNICDVCHI